MKKKKFETKAIHTGQIFDPLTGAVIPPVHFSTTFVQKEPGKLISKYDYSRASNPTRDNLESLMTSLEEGSDAFCLSSGCAAMSMVLHLLKPGDHLLASDDLYGGSVRMMDDLSKKKISVDYKDLTKNINSYIKKNTKMIWIETPSNPLLKMIDIKKLASLSKKKKILLCVDNTFLTPFFQKPLNLGADIVIHSATKYLGGHSDLLAGVIVTKDKKLKTEFEFLVKTIGSVLSPFDCYLLQRSLKTLSLRMERHEKNAKELSLFLEKHPGIQKVIYPGLKNYPYKSLAKKQTSGFGGMISFYLKNKLKIKSFLKKLEVIQLAESLGGIESLINHPFSMTHAGLSKKRKLELGINESFFRLSVGIEHIEDLKKDLNKALK